MPNRYNILVVDDDPSTLPGLVELLAGRGYDVVGSPGFQAAKFELSRKQFDLLLVDLRLEEFNGLHLVMHARARYPSIRAIVYSGYSDVVLANEASRLGAVFFQKPIDSAKLFETVENLLRRTAPERKWARKSVDFKAKIDHRWARVVDLSYGGLRFELSEDTELPSVFHVEVPEAEQAVEAQTVWSQSGPAGIVRYGAAIKGDEEAMLAWRQVVDSASA